MEQRFIMNVSLKIYKHPRHSTIERRMHFLLDTHKYLNFTRRCIMSDDFYYEEALNGGN
ncbi:hypothetical protein SAMN05443507_10338 [Alicyclobacillus tolerans]|uniref:Uncharacterized protein n=1 Tax=Alicyclobacillus tolerans TaxID=90970 RepID=A0A1M6LPC3_9BACL|nr:hypothetical protein SAMN05443507_10338 [Alicyclobacillus montanus]